MGKDRFDFSEIDAALPAAERMQEEDRVADALENNYKAVRILGANVEKLENRLSEALPRLDGAVSSLREAGRITVSGEARRTLEREGDAICRKIAGRIDRESAKMLDRLSMRDRVTISDTAFWCLIEAVISFWRLSSAPAWPTPGSCTVSCCGRCSEARQGFLHSASH